MKVNNKYNILVVDDEKDICRALDFLLSSEGYSVDTALSGEVAIEKIKEKWYDLVLTDLKMNRMDGIGLLKKAKEISPSLIVIIMTAYASVDNAVETMKVGASDYIVKPFVNEDVKIRIKRLLDHRRLSLENQALRRQLSQQLRCKEFVYKSPEMMSFFDALEKVIPTKSNILILGESGTGKGMIAEIIHYNSPRRDKSFISINCSAIPEGLLESELFGYRKGAFTGASVNKIGLIAMADGGTLFLDEIGDMPLTVQAKLLKVIESGDVMPLGDTKPRRVDIRVISATNKNIEKMIKEEKFREDLYYRLNVIELSIPLLRDRKTDIPFLVQHFIETFNSENNKHIKGVDKETMEFLMNYPWYGNVRELRNIIERAVVLCNSDIISIEDIPQKLRNKDFLNSDSLRDRIGCYERQIILEKLTRYNHNKEDVAKDLDIDLATLYRKMKKLGIGERKDQKKY